MNERASVWRRAGTERLPMAGDAEGAMSAVLASMA